MPSLGKKLLAGAGVAATLVGTDSQRSSSHRIRLETSAGFDRTVTFKKNVVADAGVTLTPIAAWYKKESDGTVASAALAPGASNKSEYIVEGLASVVTVEVSGGTAGTVDVYWASILT